MVLILYPIFLGDSKPLKMFDQTANLANNVIINYKLSPNEKWLLLIGISPGSSDVRIASCPHHIFV